MSAELILYTTWGCHLCEQAEALVQQAGQGQRLQKQDIVDDDLLYETYRTTIPVLQRTDTDAKLFWPFDAAQLQAFLA